jgi:hypothetical protein
MLWEDSLTANFHNSTLSRWAKQLCATCYLLTTHNLVVASSSITMRICPAAFMYIPHRNNPHS